MHSAKIIILCAIYAEAEPLIDYYNLKKSFPDFRPDTYLDEQGDIALVITGAGIVRAAASVGAVCTYFNIDASSHMINVGTCAGGSAMHELYRINKLVNSGSGRTFYPDILVKADMPEAAITSVARVVVDASCADMLYDMEAAAIYEAASAYLSPHQMTFLKIVSDHGSKEAVSRQAVTELVRDFLPKINSFIEKAQALFVTGDGGCRRDFVIKEGPAKEGCKYNDLKHEASNAATYIDKLALDMHCSATMTHQLASLVNYAVCLGQDYQTFFEKYYENGSCLVTDKRLAKQVIDEFRDVLIGE